MGLIIDVTMLEGHTMSCFGLHLAESLTYFVSKYEPRLMALAVVVRREQNLANKVIVQWLTKRELSNFMS